ncbi:MAG: transglycosylase domain-containing protein [Dehalococcoidia bacterium]|nr:transglycosylase domain-containing protein [Dehalococcoidia bacterium]
MAAALLALIALPAYAFCAPFDTPQSKLTIPGTVVLAADGTVLQRDGSDGFRIPVSLDQVAPAAIQATIAAEDQRFRDHPGIDPVAMFRAALKFPSERSGASTITQQLARRLYLDGGGGPLPVRKARESLIAFQLEAHHSKDEILNLYLNEVYYGRGAYGIEAAARVYFGVSAANLDLARASFLAGLPQLPSVYEPAVDDSAARARQAYVLGRMEAEGSISAAQARAAVAEPLALLPDIEPALAPHFVAWAMEELARLRPDLAGERGLVIETTLDAGLQQESERLARMHVANLADRNVTNAAVTVVEPETGRVLAMVGGVGGEETGGAINMAVAPRQPGSALKPFLYAAAFERGYTAATPLLDVPAAFETKDGLYSPQNFDKQFHGVVPLRVALASSFNVPAVRTLEAIGIPAFLEIAHRFGLNTLTEAERYGLALTLGGAEVRLIDLTAAYAALGAGGVYAEPFAVTRVRATDGTVLYERRPRTTREAASPEHAYLLADILDDADARIPGFGVSTPFELPFRAAAKTGTTTGFRDNWTMGFTSSFAVGVWVGNADGSPMREVSGIDGAGPIWRDVMLAAAMVKDPGWPVRPRGLVDADVCSPTGLLPGPDCPHPERELFVAGTEPRETESYYRRQADGMVAVFPPIEAIAWARDAGLRVGAPGAGEGQLRIVDPQPGSVFSVAPELRSQELVLRAEPPPGTTMVTFRINGETVAQLSPPDSRAVWALRPGVFELQVSARMNDGSVAVATSTFEVKPR